VRDADENILQERLQFLRPLVQQLRIRAEVRHAMDRHPPADTPPQRRPLVVGQIVARTGPEMREDLSQYRFIRAGPVVGRCGQGCEMFAKGDDRARQFRDGQDMIDETGGNGVARHLAVLGLAGVLDETDAAFFLDAFDPHRAVGARA
jgi:hypothetical protein